MTRTLHNLTAFALLALLASLSALGAGDGPVPLTTTESLNKRVDQNVGRLQKTVQDLEAMISTKRPLLDECAKRYKANPTRDNFASFYVVHFSLVCDEARLLRGLSGIATKLALCMQEDARRKRVFGAMKERDLANLQSKLEGMRRQYQALSTALAAEDDDAKRAAIERRRNALKRLIKMEWRTKMEIEKSVVRAKTSAEKATQDLGTLSVLGEGVRAQRDVTLSALRCAREKLQRGQALAPAPSVEQSRDGLNHMLRVARQIRSSVESRNVLEIQDTPAAAGQAESLHDQVQDFLDKTDAPQATSALEGKDSQ